MLLDLSPIIKVAGARIELNEELKPNGKEFLGEQYSFKKPLKINGAVYNNGQSLTLAVHVSGIAETECARCLAPVEIDVDYDVYELLSQAEDDSENEEEDVIFFTGHELELDDIIADHFLMNLCGKYLCRDDCKGLCPNCGRNLNDGDCNCKNDYIDPRWQQLRDILNRQSNSAENKE